MDLQQFITLFNEALFDTDRDRALQVVREAVNQGVTAEEIVFEAVIPAMEHLVTAFGEGFELSLAQHFLTSQIAADVTEEMIPQFRRAPETIGRVVIGSPEGDLHTLGKRIVVACLRGQMIECSDLGVNIAPEQFVAEAVAQGAQVIAISAMMVHTARGKNGCLRVRQLLKERELENRIKIIVGGAPFRFDPQLYQRVQADAWAADGIRAGHVIAGLIQEVRP
jgi:methanogenic corrinoid protein MtbC1